MQNDPCPACICTHMQSISRRYDIGKWLVFCEVEGSTFLDYFLSNDYERIYTWMRDCFGVLVWGVDRVL